MVAQCLWLERIARAGIIVLKEGRGATRRGGLYKLDEMSEQNMRQKPENRNTSIDP